jgi:hypothetical protein
MTPTVEDGILCDTSTMTVQTEDQPAEMTEASIAPVAAMTPQDQESRDEALDSRNSVTLRADSSSEITKQHE